MNIQELVSLHRGEHYLIKLHASEDIEQILANFRETTERVGCGFTVIVVSSMDHIDFMRREVIVPEEKTISISPD